MKSLIIFITAFSMGFISGLMIYHNNPDLKKQLKEVKIVSKISYELGCIDSGFSIIINNGEKCGLKNLFDFCEIKSDKHSGLYNE